MESGKTIHGSIKPETVAKMPSPEACKSLFERQARNERLEKIMKGLIGAAAIATALRILFVH